LKAGVVTEDFTILNINIFPAKIYETFFFFVSKESEAEASLNKKFKWENTDFQHAYSLFPCMLGVSKKLSISPLFRVILFRTARLASIGQTGLLLVNAVARGSRATLCAPR
jgi:hypothetical protein